MDKLKDTRCHSNYGRQHAVVEMSPRFPLFNKKISLMVDDEPPNKPVSIKYKVFVVCSICDQSAYLDQDDNIIERHNRF